MAKATSKERTAKVTVKDLEDILANGDGIFELPGTSHDLVYPNIYISEE